MKDGTSFTSEVVIAFKNFLCLTSFLALIHKTKQIKIFHEKLPPFLLDYFFHPLHQHKQPILGHRLSIIGLHKIYHILVVLEGWCWSSNMHYSRSICMDLYTLSHQLMEAHCIKITYIKHT